MNDTEEQDFRKYIKKRYGIDFFRPHRIPILIDKPKDVMKEATNDR